MTASSEPASLNTRLETSALNSPSVAVDLISEGDGEICVSGAAPCPWPTLADDYLVGSKSSEEIRGLAGNDTIIGRGGNDTLRGQNGDDKLKGGHDDDKLVGGEGDDKLLGGVGNDSLIGGLGNDVLKGGDGEDVLKAAFGNNKLSGGADADKFIFAASATGANTITDFEIGVDRLKLNGIDVTGVSEDRHGNAIIELSNGGSIKLNGVNAEEACDIIPREDGWIQWSTLDGGNGHWYKIVIDPEGMTWNEANARAEALACGTAYLATTTSADENAFVFENFVDDFAAWTDTGQGPYFGLIQDPDGSEPSGGWGWVTGEEFDYTNWARGEPNNVVNGAEDFGQFGTPEFTRPVGTWNDIVSDNGEPIAFVVEVDEWFL
ncbi:hypothetical protein [Tateyamaria pelophila]|uniref:hypothetical protein n=1 Tax=Tateyamaria pelophila TaxID=328415 RepID=UPI001CC0DD57|nr:hypothetical protein [Tateyamaria pelophila]